MKKLLENPGILATAWFVVVALVLGLGTLAFLQPLPPATGEGAVVVLMPREAQADEQGAGEPAAGEQPHAESTPAEAPAPAEPAVVPLPNAGATAEAESGNQAQGAEPPAKETAAEPVQVPLAPPTPPEPAAEHGSETAAAPGEPTQAETSQAETTHAEPAEQPQAAAEAAPENKAKLPPPEKPAAKPETDHTAAAANSAAAESGTTQAESPGEATQETMLSIPAVPPAPEELPQWKRYSQPFDSDDKRPRIAVVLSGLGLSDSATEAAIETLPPAVTLSFSPYARGLERWIALARARGHEVMLDLPMEPTSFPNEDPGPQGLLVSLKPEANLDRLDWVLSRGSAYVGVAGAMGSRFTASREALEPVLQELKQRGLMFLDRRTTEDSLVPALAGELSLPLAINNRSVDERQASRVAIDARLAQIERIALTDGFAVAMAQPYPVSLDRLAEWTTEISSRGFAIAPISALANRQKMP